MSGAPPTTDGELVFIDRFIEATRDSGYKSTAAAIAELVDNALDAGAKRIHVRVASGDDDSSIAEVIAVQDDGCGMSADVMRRALGFGGTTRFNARDGLGRYGMGLPNSSVSQARRVTLYSRTDGGPILRTHLDVDEIATGGVRSVAEPVEAEWPDEAPEPCSATGTLVLWTQCDRLENRRVSTITRKLTVFLGRVYRYFIWRGIELLVNGQRVRPIDPLFLASDSITTGGQAFGDPIRVEVNTMLGGSGVVEISFVELPVAELSSLDNDDKRARGVTGGAGVSVVRGDREVDYGWYFIKKRRENYDDWWRCEVRFDPVLDEQFGITHTKQQIRPSAELEEAIGETVDTLAHKLNSRVRAAYLQAKAPAGDDRAEPKVQAPPAQITGAGVNRSALSKGGPTKGTSNSEATGGSAAKAAAAIAPEPTGLSMIEILPHSDDPSELRAAIQRVLTAASRAKRVAKNEDEAALLERYQLAWHDEVRALSGTTAAV